MKTSFWESQKKQPAHVLHSLNLKARHTLKAAIRRGVHASAVAILPGLFVPSRPPNPGVYTFDGSFPQFAGLPVPPPDLRMGIATDSEQRFLNEGHEIYETL